MAIRRDAEVAEAHDVEVTLGDAKTLDAGEIGDERGDGVGLAPRQQRFPQLRCNVDPGDGRWIESSGGGKKREHDSARCAWRRRDPLAARSLGLVMFDFFSDRTSIGRDFVNLEHADDLGAGLLAIELDQGADIGERHVVGAGSRPW